MGFLRFLWIAGLVASVLGETFCPVTTSKTGAVIGSSKLSSYRIVQYNVEWLFVDYYAASNCPGNGCSWKTKDDALVHIDYVSKIINELNPDIINLCEVEGCDELALLANGSATTNGLAYSPYIIKGADTSTGQNIGMLSRVVPASAMYRTEDRVAFPIPGSMCGYTGAAGDSGVSKHYITEFLLGSLRFAMIAAHLVAFPTDPARCAQREAQAQVLQNVITGYIEKGMDVIMLGDFNDFDAEVHDANNNKPTSHVLDILKGKFGDKAGKYSLINVAEKIMQADRYSDWWDENKNCNSTTNEFSMIDHILVTPGLHGKIKNQFIYKGYPEYCGTFNSDHYPVVIDIAL